MRAKTSSQTGPLVLSIQPMPSSTIGTINAPSRRPH